MLTNFSEVPLQPKSIPQSDLTLRLSKDAYQSYLAFLFQTSEQITEDEHILYLEKVGFDAILDQFGDQDLLVLQQKEDMYMHCIMYNTFKICGLINEEEFDQNITALSDFFLPTEDELLFMSKIENIVKASLKTQISPYSYLKTYGCGFSEKLKQKLSFMLKYMIGDSMCYKTSPQQIFALCLKWTMDRYQIKNPVIHGLISQLIDTTSQETTKKIGQITSIMEQILQMENQV